jgi:hypothetical protein
VLEPFACHERVEVLADVQPEDETEDLARMEESQEVGRGLSLRNPELLAKHFGQRTVGHAAAVRDAPAGPAQRLRRTVGEQLPELAHEPRLADPRVADDRDEPGPTRFQRRLVRLLEHGELGVASDENRVEPADSARTLERERAQESAARNALSLSLHGDHRRLVELERPANRLDGPLADDDLAGRGALLQAGADVDCVSGDERASLARRADDDAARVHADTELELLAEERAEPALHRQRGVESALGVILLGDRRAERRHDRVADELLDRPTGLLDLLGHGVVEPDQQGTRPLRILLAELRRPDEVGEEHGRHLAFLSPAHVVIVAKAARCCSSARLTPLPVVCYGCY